MVTVDQAREFFMDKSQQLMGITPDALPDEGMVYYADDRMCLAFHRAPYPDVWMVHVAAKPVFWGRLDGSGRYLLNLFWNAFDPQRIVAWTPVRFRHAIALAKRCGFVDDGRMSLPDGDVAMMGWRA